MELFGTDGIRGLANEKLTSQIAYKLGRALAIVFGEKKKALIARDNRVSGQMLQSALETGLLEGGVDIANIEVATSPCTSFLVKNEGFDFAVIITASHNMAEFNGIKVFNNLGEKISDEIEIKLEETMLNIDNYKVTSKSLMGQKTVNTKLIKKYIDFLKGKAEFNKFSEKICIDCANGAATKICRRLLNELKINAKIINTNKSGLLINKKSGATYAKAISDATIKNKAIAGFSLDGDADRIIVALNDGTVLDGDLILYFLAKTFKNKNKLNKNEIVATVISNYGLDSSLKKQGITVSRVKVGDNFVYEELKNKKLSLGGEKSGHIINAELLPCSDGLLVIIFILNELYKNANALKQKISDLKLFKQAERTIEIEENFKNSIMQNKELIKLIEDCEEFLIKNGRILVRPSGTESIIRVLVEGEDEDKTNKIADLIKQKIEIISHKQN